MSYQVLARKWRPKSFPELVGQEHVKNTLINALEMGRLHHAYLFTGTRGVGKTTIARIFAKSLNCAQGITANPCGQCDVCLSIEKGQFVDLIEIDAASRTKVEDTREILDNVQYAPTQGRFKVYLIDEVHMLSRHSFNALLKTLEEPPPHVKFLLATTDPQKLPITILSRCLQFNLRALLRNEIIEHLKYILGEETISFDEESLRLLAKSADGSLRDALSLTDQAIAQSKGGLTAILVRQMLGTIDQQWSVKLLAHIVNQNPDKALDTVEEIAQFMPDYRNLIDQLLSLFHLAAMSQLVPSVAKIDENMQAFVTRLAQKLSPQDVQLYYQILLNGKKDIELAPDPRMGFEMVLLRVLAFQPL
ncbi:MAG: DNA polymerase III subunit gamma/tau, partial [Psychrosphaera sp.]|nr:DNA polymerase III subunit gamma/tau [Psychrosphaera sp.]